ncbi:hypothetical protein R1sor_007576 [Riccia sorocarpa]|uniref:Uncharacterized protein n=1 Tax=Riccia sorocarpa TaxID=122646 RepID=A0ABD3HUH8_9MARC
MTLEKPFTTTPAVETTQRSSTPETKAVCFDPRVLEVTPNTASGSEGWPSDKEWSVNAVSTRSKKDLLIVPNSREHRKKAKRSRRKAKKVDVISTTSSDEQVDTTPLKYKDDISHVIKSTIARKLGTEDPPPIPKEKEVQPATTIASTRETMESGMNATLKGSERKCLTPSESTAGHLRRLSADTRDPSINSFFIECYEADDTELAAFDNEVRTLFISGMEAIEDNGEPLGYQRPTSLAEPTFPSGKTSPSDTSDQILKLHQIWQLDPEPSTEEVPTREDEVVGATTF